MYELFAFLVFLVMTLLVVLTAVGVVLMFRLSRV